ncbi:FecR domain-containing protein [Verrucomicrobium sp. BvORR106]|uniref:FecR domain-containing protein n=1 Tax=Verrucomicrobium sp. BvORR106 TaxID=1403819 RepID=UPI000570A6F7|nr:FecR domain-containing protein [Verrucomicrobium sp. BvORR106]
MMNNTPPQDSPDMDRALNLLIEGELSAEQAAVLQERMKAEPALLKRYLALVRIDSLLRDRGWKDAANEPTASIVSVPSSRWRSPIVRRTLLAAAALAVLLLVAGLWQVGQKQPPAMGVVPSVKFSPTSVFETVAPQSTDDGQLRFGDAVAMTDGSVSIRLPSGVEAVIKSPARFSITGQNSVQLDKGFAWFRVPPQAKGFSVELPWMTVVDLGTVFTTQVEDQLHEVRVDQGRVEARLKGAPSSVQSLTAGQMLVLRAPSDQPLVQSSATPSTPNSLADEGQVVFKEMLKHVPDQSFADRHPLTGTWEVLQGVPMIRDGKFSAGSNFIHLMGRFAKPVEKNAQAVVILSFKSVSPKSLFHSKGFAGVSLFDRNGEMFFLGDKGSDSYSWELLTFGQKFRGPEEVRTAYNLSIQGSEETFTLRYRQRTGEFDVFKGWGVEGLPILKGRTDANMRIDGVRIANGEGGDFSFENLQVTVVKDVGAEK